MSIRRKPRQYGLVLKCDGPGCAEAFDTGQTLVKHAREHAIRQLGWMRMTSDVYGAQRKNDLCPVHAAAARERKDAKVKARKERADARAAGKRYVGPPPPGWAACPTCEAHVLKRADGGLRAHAPGLGRVTKRGQALCGEVSPPLEPAQPGVSP